MDCPQAKDRAALRAAANHHLLLEQMLDVPAQRYPLDGCAMADCGHCFGTDDGADKADDLHRRILGDTGSSDRQERIPGADAIHHVPGERRHLEETFAGPITQTAALAARHYHATAMKPLRQV